MTTKAELKEWFDEGRRQHATHMIVVCDTFDYEDYPVYVQQNEDARTVASHYDGKNMQRLMEVYDLRFGFEIQAQQARVFNY